jgi:DNA-binding NarL/FixJ family response regulator
MDALSRRHTTVLLDRHPLWLAELSRRLEQADLELVGTTTTEPRALQLIREHQPDVLIFEPEACTSSTARFLDAARSTRPQLKAIAVSTVDDPEVIRETLQAGAWAYVLKHAAAEDIAVAVRQAFVHSIHLARPFDPAHATGDGGRAAQKESADVSILTKREREILALVAEGHSNSAMAKQLWVTEQTVKFHLANIYRKIGVPNRTAASRWAHERGMVGSAPSLDQAFAFSAS